MNDIEPQTANGKVLWHFTMSLDGFVAGPNHEMDWMMTGIPPQPGLIKALPPDGTCGCRCRAGA
ncbi:hypothetical protein [Acrocarpospora sp. B8E8]|uniref:hypothetical protein n=1 Tax=Acrocarpospora sp. B8E8 TaxID=3153572 RepID=UPI00325C5948